MHTNHKACEKLFIDYAGRNWRNKTRRSICDHTRSKPTQLCGSLFHAKNPRFFKQHTKFTLLLWRRSSLHYPRQPQVSSNKVKSIRTFINEQFAGFASHYDTSIMPTRPLKPKDKSLVEGAVNIAYTLIFDALCNTEF
jgi:hypothetical protein